MTRRRLRTLWADRRGIAAVEFGFVLPLLILLFCGLFEVANAVIVYMKVIDVADTVSELIAQQTSVSSSDFDNLLIAGRLVMQPDSGTGVGLAIASIKFDASSGNPSVAWQVTRGTGTAMTDAASAATGLGSKGDTVIEAKANYTYTSLLKYVMPSGISLSARVFSRPRSGGEVACSSSPCS